MTDTSLSPLSVVDYQRDYVIEFVRYVTGWTERSEVSRKAQLCYICNYLETAHINCQTIVVESDYIERHYLEDYAEYYARCFHSHPRKCSRLHFFSNKFCETKFTKCLRGSAGRANTPKELQDNYIGFAVIRPIPHTVFARVCLRPFEDLLSNKYCKILSRKVPVSLFGLNLWVETIPFIEQDKVVSACATSALWVALSANPNTSLNDLPSPSAITKAAAIPSIDAARTFPTSGLSPPQILRGLRHFNLEPSIIWDDTETLNDLKAQVYSYLSHGTPLILGGALFRKDNEIVTKLGSHLVCITGCAIAIEDDMPPRNKSQRLLSKLVSKFFAHDDQNGPYLQMHTKQHEFCIRNEQKTHHGLEMSVAGHAAYLFEPSIAIIGLYHKIRIPYPIILNACGALYKHLHETQSDLLDNSAYGDAKQKAIDKDYSNLIDILLIGYWEISLTTESRVKEELISSRNFFSFNGIPNKITPLTWNMPKYVWRCRILDGNNIKEQIPITDIIFDATEVPQGDIVIGMISYSHGANKVWSYIGKCIEERRWQGYRLDQPETEEFIRCFIHFFSQNKNSSSLNAFYGALELPRRSLKPGEADKLNNVSQRRDVYIIQRDGTVRDWSFLNLFKSYIWVINDVGDIVIGEDIAKNDLYKGHPTLIDGRPGRIAGELYYSQPHKKLFINSKSGAYSRHIERSFQEKYLNNVIKLNLIGMIVEVASTGKPLLIQDKPHATP